MANRNPSPETRFGAGNKANPMGKTAKQRQMEIENARLATEIRRRLLKAVNAVVQKAPDEHVLARVEAGVLKLLKDAEDRGLGTPTSTVDVTTNGKDLPGAVDLTRLSDAALAEIVAARDATKKD